MTASEQARIQFNAPKHLSNAIAILVEMGLRPYKELLPMKKSQIDLENMLVHISDSKTTNGIGDMPMTELAHAAFKAQFELTPGSEYLFPPRRKPSSKPHLTSLKKTWVATLQRLPSSIAAQRAHRDFWNIKAKVDDFWNTFGTLSVFFTVMKNGIGLNLKELAGGDDGARTRDLMRDRQDHLLHFLHSLL